MRDLTITLIQADLIWEDIDANLAAFENCLPHIDPGTDLIVLPEMFTTGFTMHPRGLAQKMSDSGVRWLGRTAREMNADVTGSLVIEDGGRFYNRMVWAKPTGELLTYDKRHLFRMAGEDKVYHAGERRITVELAGWKIRPFVCYDLRFPIWTRNVGPAYDLAVFIANWPARRSSHWKALLTARAIENQCYVAAVNRIGTDGNGLEYSGDSAIIDPTGRTCFQNTGTPCIHTEILSRELLAEYRREFPAWMDSDSEVESLFR